MTEAELRRALRPGLSHHQLEAAENRRSAVLVPVEPGRGVWLTRRSPLLPNHAGQVSFPGGKIETQDMSVEAAALREAIEEIGLDAARAEVMGRMDDFITGTGFHISPVVALIRNGSHFKPAPGEVQEVFWIDFAMLLDPQLPRLRRAFWRGQESEFYVWPHQRHVVWGATARILLDLAIRLREER